MDENKGIVTKEMIQCFRTGTEILITIDDDLKTQFKIQKEIADKDFDPNCYTKVYKSFNGFITHCDYKLQKSISCAQFYFNINTYRNSFSTVFDLLIKILKVNDRIDFILSRDELQFNFTKWQVEQLEGQEKIKKIYPVVNEKLYMRVWRNDKIVINNVLLFAEKVVDKEPARRIKIKEEQKLKIAA